MPGTLKYGAAACFRLTIAAHTVEESIVIAAKLN